MKLTNGKISTTEILKNLKGCWTNGSKTKGFRECTIYFITIFNSQALFKISEFNCYYIRNPDRKYK